MAAAYAFADGGQMPNELRLLDQIDRFGVQAVLGRPLGAKEIIHMRTAENIVRLHQARGRSKSWAGWAKENPEGAALLNYCMELVEDGLDG
jgi:hypothetical protein